MMWILVFCVAAAGLGFGPAQASDDASRALSQIQHARALHGPAAAAYRNSSVASATPSWARGPEWARGDPKEAPEPGPIRRTSKSPPWPKDFEVGLQAARAFAHYFGLVETDSLLHRVNRLGYEVASQVGKSDALFTFHILDLPDPNALALPGGFIFLTRGMMELDLGDPALAHLIGHEIAHVTEGHFSRSDRVQTALSLLHTAVVVAAIIAVPSRPSGIDRDPETGMHRVSLSGKDAAVQGSTLFGGLFRELLVRGYGRGLEMEADDVGRRYAGRAGYAAAGGVELMEQLHLRIYEDQEYGYWRTHPFFNDRVARARAAVDAGGSAPSPDEIREYRERIQRRLASLAGTIEDEPTAMFLYRAALAAGPGGESGLEVERRLLALRAERLHKKKPVLRAYGPLIADYDSLLARFDRADGINERMARQARSEREKLDRERRDLYPTSREIVDRKNAGIQLLELFVDNFPDDPEAPNVRLRLAELYRLSGRPDEAALSFEELHRQSLPEADARSLEALAGLRQVLPSTRELTTAQRILMQTPSDSVRIWANERLVAQAASLDSLEVGSRFLEEFPVSAVSDQVRDKVEELAMQRYYRARLREGMRDFQGALDGYNELALLARRTSAAQLARDGVLRIQAVAQR